MGNRAKSSVPLTPIGPPLTPLGPQGTNLEPLSRKKSQFNSPGRPPERFTPVVEGSAFDKRKKRVTGATLGK